MGADRVRVKICCIGSVEEAARAVAHGASAIGLVSHMPSGPGVLPEERIGEIAASVPPDVSTFLLTSRTDPAGITRQQRRCRVDAIQLCDRLGADAHRRLRDALPGVSLVQVVHVTGEASIDEAAAVAPTVDALLLDSGRPGAAVKELGGTGRVHDWEISRAIRDRVTAPVFLAGGLRAGNVRAAIEAVRPFGVDLCTGVRTRGALDGEKLRAFMREVRSAGAGERHRPAADGRPDRE